MNDETENRFSIQEEKKCWIKIRKQILQVELIGLNLEEKKACASIFEDNIPYTDIPQG